MKVLIQITDFQIESPEIEYYVRQDNGRITEKHNPRNILTLRPKGWGRKNGVVRTFGRSEWLKLCKEAETRAVYFAYYTRPETGVEHYFYAYKGTYYVSQIFLPYKMIN